LAAKVGGAAGGQKELAGTAREGEDKLAEQQGDKEGWEEHLMMESKGCGAVVRVFFWCG